MPTTKPGKLTHTLGWVLTGLIALAMTASGIVKLLAPAGYVESVEKIQWTKDNLSTLALIELACVAVYLFPKTAVLGATLIVGYFGGAVATYVRIDQPNWPVPIAFGVVAWLALFLRYPALRKLTPLTS
ncbi:MAG: DoxX family protein [Planctomycetota bacterium]